MHGFENVGVYATAAVARIFFDVSVNVSVVLTGLTSDSCESNDLATGLCRVIVDAALIAIHVKILSPSESVVKLF
jgi:hypothetical protein